MSPEEDPMIRRETLTLCLSTILIALVVAVSGFRGATPEWPTVEVRSFGMLREIIRQGRIEGRARIKDAADGTHAYALGALAGLHGEFVMLDGRAHLSRPDGRGGTHNSVSEAGEDSVALMVAARVPSWRTVPVDAPISLDALEDTLAARATALGLQKGGPFPFLVQGGLHDLRWHVVDGSRIPPGPSDHQTHMKAAVRGARDTVTATLLGFYSDHHVGVLLHHDRDVHVHVLLPPDGIAAHVDGVTLDAGAVLRLPRVH